MVNIDRIPGYTGPLSDRIITDGTYFEPATEERLQKYAGKEVYVASKDGRVFGGRDFRLSLFYLKDGYINIYRDNYLGGGWAKIPLDEILGIRLAW